MDHEPEPFTLTEHESRILTAMFELEDHEGRVFDLDLDRVVSEHASDWKETVWALVRLERAGILERRRVLGVESKRPPVLYVKDRDRARLLLGELAAAHPGPLSRPSALAERTG